MEDSFVFQSDKEIKRLRVQNELLFPYEKPIFDLLFSKGKNLSVLDIGCNDGNKTTSSFSYDSISKVIGIEYNVELATKAEKEFGNNKFYFTALDAEQDDFSEHLREIMKQKGIVAFDCIYLSFVLMHLKNPRKVLLNLHNFLKEDGSLVVVEANDSASYLSSSHTGENDNLLRTFLEILREDKYSGNRTLGSEVENIVKECGYKDIRFWCDAVCAKRGEKERKKDIITTFFSYLSEDVDILLEEENKDIYKEWKEWLSNNWKELESIILNDESEISMGMKIISCKKSCKNFKRT